MSRQAEMSAESRARLLEAAWELFAEDGARKTTVQAIAERARISRGSIAWHFGSKQGLVVAVVEDAFAQLEEQTRAVLDEAGPAGWDRVVRAQMVMLNDKRFTIFATVGLEAIVDQDEVLKAIAAGQQKMRELYADYLKNHDLITGEIDPLAAAGAFRALSLGLSIQHRFDDSVPDVRQALKALRGVLAEIPPDTLDQ
jgi:AcrR family transcriptional regulator